MDNAQRWIVVTGGPGMGKSAALAAWLARRVSEYRLHHDSIRAHIAEAIGVDALAAHHLALARRLATWPAPAEETALR